MGFKPFRALKGIYIGLKYTCMSCLYHINSNWDRMVRANSANPDQTAPSDQGLHCLPVHLHLLDALVHCLTKQFDF